jgi:hypothetical protein
VLANKSLQFLNQPFGQTCLARVLYGTSGELLIAELLEQRQKFGVGGFVEFKLLPPRFGGLLILYEKDETSLLKHSADGSQTLWQATVQNWRSSLSLWPGAKHTFPNGVIGG